MDEGNLHIKIHNSIEISGSKITFLTKCDKRTNRRPYGRAFLIME